MSTQKSTADLVARLDAIRSELGSAWAPGWRGVVHEEAATIIDALEARGTEMARRCLVDHGLASDEAGHKAEA